MAPTVRSFGKRCGDGWNAIDRLAALDSAIARGIADAEAGRVHDIDEVRTELRQRLAERD